LRVILHILLFILLTILTQIGGIIYLISIVLIRKKSDRKRVKRLGTFIGLYLITTFFIVPYLAPIFGRVKIEDSDTLRAHSFFYKLANRNYVRKELNQSIKRISSNFENDFQGMKIVYLDANFPFIDGFPLLPHLSHNDGKKIDITLIYEEANLQLTNRKPSVSGYGIYENPTDKEYNQIDICKKSGNWQYDFPKYLTFGKINSDIRFSKKGTGKLVGLILADKNIGKLFIEPHLKSRLGLKNEKIRYHGCKAVRHDDHIHFQLR